MLSSKLAGTASEIMSNFKVICCKINLFDNIRPAFSFFVSAISQFMKAPKQIHQQAGCRILRYLKGAIGLDFL